MWHCNFLPECRDQEETAAYVWIWMGKTKRMSSYTYSCIIRIEIRWRIVEENVRWLYPAHLWIWTLFWSGQQCIPQIGKGWKQNQILQLHHCIHGQCVVNSQGSRKISKLGWHIFPSQEAPRVLHDVPWGRYQ